MPRLSRQEQTLRLEEITTGYSGRTEFLRSTVHEESMDTSEQSVFDETPEREVRRRRSVEEKRRIVEETLETGESVARVARRHAVNANQVFHWRKKYREGRLGKSQPSKFLPVALSDISGSKSGRVARQNAARL
jgi:transposase-like protein